MTNTPQDTTAHPRDKGTQQYEAKQQTPYTGLPLAHPQKREERDVLNTELAAGDVLAGGRGRMKLVSVGDVDDVRPGFVKIETEDFGLMWLDEDGSSRVAGDNDDYFQFTPETMTINDFSDVFQAAKGRFGVAGTYFSDEDIDSAIDNLTEEDDDPESERDYKSLYAEMDRDAIRNKVKSSYTWRHLGDRMAETGNESIDDRVREAIADEIG